MTVPFNTPGRLLLASRLSAFAACTVLLSALSSCSSELPGGDGDDTTGTTSDPDSSGGSGGDATSPPAGGTSGNSSGGAAGTSGGAQGDGDSGGSSSGGSDLGTGGNEGAGGSPPAVCPETYTNPLIWEDLPDVEVIRVDDAYYYTASTFHQSPGAPVLRSYDLINWEYVSHSVPQLDFDASYNLNGDRSYVNGIWASTLQYRKSNETFYWMGCMHNVGGGWVFTSKSPEGPWEKHKGGCYYDMGLLIDDDDKMYVVYGNNDISVATLSEDGFSQLANQRVLTNTTSVAGGPLEGSRFIKRGNYYYIFLTQYANGEWVTRSTSPTGPYETPRPFAERLPYGGATGSGGQPHQGGVVDTQNGDWYYIGFNDSYPAGRIPVMAPVTWSDDWPVVELVNGQFGGSYPFPDLPCGTNRVKAWNPDDLFAEPTLAPEWEWNHNPDNTKWSSGDGLTLQTATVTTDLYAAKNTLTRRIEGPIRIATIELDYSMMQNGDAAGLAAFRDQSAWIGVKKGSGSARVVMVSGLNLNTSWETTSTGTEVAGADISGNKIWLRVEADVRTSNGGGTAKFSYSTNGSEFQALGNTLTLNKNWQFFLGYRFGIFNYATQALGGSVKIASFKTQAP